MKMWLNGRLISSHDATIAATSVGALLGWGVFTTIGIWNARPFALDLHFARLRHDAARAQIEYSIDEQTLKNALSEVIFANEIERGMARISITKRGDGRWNTDEGHDISIIAIPLADAQNSNSCVSETARNHDSSATSSTRNGDLRLTLSPFRVHSCSATGGLKTTSYLEAQMAWREAQSRGFDETLRLNERDEIAEGVRSNFFFVRDKTLCTPALSSGGLPGIARALTIEWAREEQIAALEDAFFVADLLQADACFLTSAVTGIREVRRFQGAATRDFAPQNPIVARLQKRWRDAVNP